MAIGERQEGGGGHARCASSAALPGCSIGFLQALHGETLAEDPDGALDLPLGRRGAFPADGLAAHAFQVFVYFEEMSRLPQEMRGDVPQVAVVGEQRIGRRHSQHLIV